MYVAFWEVRSLLYLGVGYMLAANLIRTRRDVGILVLVFLVANGLYALEGAFRYVCHGPRRHAGGRARSSTTATRW